MYGTALKCVQTMMNSYCLQFVGMTVLKGLKGEKMKKESNSAGGVALWLFIILLLLLIILGGITLMKKRSGGTEAVSVSASESVSETGGESETETTTQTPTDPEPTVGAESFEGLEIDSEAALLTDIDGNELFSQNKYEQIYPASLTKIMTAIVAIENVYNIDETIMISGSIYDQVNAENGSTAGFLAYEEVSYRDLLYGAVLSSGAECCLTLANYISGSEWDFVQLMNQKAKELGMENTNFTNVCGFQNYEHYSTAADISLLLRYALKNDTFYEIFTSQSYYTETDEHPDGITLSSTLFSELDSSYFDGGRILGGKTGYTDEAGLCLASLAEIDGKQYVLVTTGAPGSHYTEPLHISDALNVYERLAAALNGETIPKVALPTDEWSQDETQPYDEWNYDEAQPYDEWNQDEAQPYYDEWQ